MNFVKGNFFPAEEGIEIEFKEVKNHNNLNSFKSNTEKYIIGFANARSNGSIYFGITDNGEIVGLTMDSNHKDQCDQIIHNKIMGIKPAIPPNLYEVIWHEVINPEEERLYVVEISIKGEALLKISELFKSPSGKSFYKSGGICQELTQEKMASLQIQRSNELDRERLNIVNIEIELCPRTETHSLELLLSEKKYLGLKLSDSQVIKEAYDGLVTISPNQEKLRIQEATDLDNICKPTDALEVLDQIIQDTQQNPGFRIYAKKGDILYSLKDFEAALDEYKTAIHINPDDYQTLAAIGTVLASQGDYQGALVFFNKSLNICPQYRFASYSKKQAYAKLRADL